mgnify:CR=1 FL=1
MGHVSVEEKVVDALKAEMEEQKPSLVFTIKNSKGEIVSELPYFKECIEIVDLEEVDSLIPMEQEVPEIGLIHDALVLGVRDYFQKLGFKN